MNKFVSRLLVAGLLLTSSMAYADTIKIAVTSNFLATLKALSKDFTKQTGIQVQLSNGATGMLYAQIQRGAPYDMFFAADAHRPELLDKEGLIVPGSRFTYVTGKLVSWSPNAVSVNPDLQKLNADNKNLHFVAIANPKTAPYGEAAVLVLKHYGLYEKLRRAGKIALGENVGKTFHYAASGNAQLGLVAKSYVSNPEKPVGGRYFEIPTNLYPKLVQQAVILKGKNTPAVQAFLKYFKSEAARKRIEAYGYLLGD